MPIGPSIAAWRILDSRTHFMNGTIYNATNDGPVRPHRRLKAPLTIKQLRAWVQIAGLNQLTKGDLWRRLWRLHGLDRAFVQRQSSGDALFGHFTVNVFTFAANPVTAKTACDRARCACSKKWIKDDVAGLRTGEQYAIQQCLRLLRGVRLHAIALQPLLSATNGDKPIGPHLQLVIQRLHRAIVERIFRLFAL